ncbi:MAG: hypothetical protein LBP34_01070 [Flavobacteriaceae bacterium]|nr:hypothetical protein [Flavobacteriaceae bacterium]
MDPFNTLSLSATAGGGDTFLSVGKSHWTGSVSSMTLNTVVGAEAFVGGGVSTPLGGISGEGSISFDLSKPFNTNYPRWITGSAGVTWGAKVHVSGGVRYSNTRVGIGFDGNVRVADASGLVTGKQGNTVSQPIRLP